MTTATRPLTEADLEPHVAATFAASIEGARGALVFGNGLPALRVEDVCDAGGYLEVTTEYGHVCHVRTEAVAYFRFGED